VLINNIEINIDREVPCPCCGEPLVLYLPISVTPGDDVDTDLIGWTKADEVDRWSCPDCGMFAGFPDDYVQEV
jgi:hypothetical protein